VCFSEPQPHALPIIGRKGVLPGWLFSRSGWSLGRLDNLVVENYETGEGWKQFLGRVEGTTYIKKCTWRCHACLFNVQTNIVVSA